MRGELENARELLKNVGLFGRRPSITPFAGMWPRSRTHLSHGNAPFLLGRGSKNQCGQEPPLFRCEPAQSHIGRSLA